MSNLQIKELIAPHFIVELESLNNEELRYKRELCQKAEEVLSLQRRLVQGRLDILKAEVENRQNNPDHKFTDVSKLINELPSILSESYENCENSVQTGDETNEGFIGNGDGSNGNGGNRLALLKTPENDLGPDFDVFLSKLDEVVDGGQLSNLNQVSIEEIASISEKLDELEKVVSQERQQIHRHIDILQSEVVRRYKTGEASVETILVAESKEKN